MGLFKSAALSGKQLILFAYGILMTHRGLELQVGDFDYNLLSSKLEFKELVLNGLPSQAQPATLKARHVVMMIPAWRMAIGSFENAQMWIDATVERRTPLPLKPATLAPRKFSGS